MTHLPDILKPVLQDVYKLKEYVERVKKMMYEQKGIINNLKRNQKEILESKSSMKYSLEGCKDTCQQAEARVHKPEGKTMGITESEKEQ